MKTSGGCPGGGKEPLDRSRRVEKLIYLSHLTTNSGKMLSKVDEKGRLYLGRGLRERLGKEVYVVEIDGGILIVPKPKDPVKALEMLGATLPDKPIRELRKEIAEKAEEEFG